MPRIWMPGMRRAWARNMAPNFPAPISPTRNGLPAAARSCSSAWRFIALLGRAAFAPRVIGEAVVAEHGNRRKVVVGDPARALEAADGVVAAVEREIENPARPRRQIRARGVDQIAVEQQDRARRPLGRDDAALGHQARNGLVVAGPERIAGGGDVVAGREPAQAVAFGDEHQRAVELVGFGDEQRDVHGARRRHVVVVEPGGVILVPLPHRAIERRLGVDLELVHVEPVGAKELHAGLDQARMARQNLEYRVPGLDVEGAARRSGILLVDHLRPLLREDARQLVADERHLFGRKHRGQEQIALFLEFRDLGWRELHGPNLPKTWPPPWLWPDSLIESRGRAERDYFSAAQARSMLFQPSASAALDAA